jgi:hypothetical protein
MQLNILVWVAFAAIMGTIASSAQQPAATVLLALILTATMFMAACAGGTGIAPPPPSGTTLGTYTVTITGTAGTLQDSLPLTLNVRP